MELTARALHRKQSTSLESQQSLQTSRQETKCRAAELKVRNAAASLLTGVEKGFKYHIQSRVEGESHLNHVLIR